MSKVASDLNILFWGTYDLGKPRLRILMRGLKENQVKVTECHYEVWSSVEDKSQIKGIKAILYYSIKLLIGYPFLVAKFLVAKKPDIVFIGYLGHFDILILYPFAKLGGIPIVWDAFLSLYNTVVEDRKLINPEHPLAHLLFFFESLSCRAADLILLDTQAHADYFIERFKIPPPKIKSVFVGVEPETFPSKGSIKQQKSNGNVTVLFYGQFIPLHGISTIIQAARLAKKENISWVLIGKGQEEENIQDLLEEDPLPKLQWIPWVSYIGLANRIHTADICLGIFGDTEKAARVIPNKVFQILSSGAPLITLDSPAIRELVHSGSQGIVLVPPANPVALLEGIHQLTEQSFVYSDPLHRQITDQILPINIGHQLVCFIRKLC